MWELVIIYGISKIGAGGYNFAAMPDKQTCYDAIKNVKIIEEPESNITKSNGNIIIYCRQYEESK